MNYELLSKDLIKEKYITILSGAGISTQSGLSDFRGENGLYSKSVDGEKILSKDYFDSNPLEFYKFYRENLLKTGVLPNENHFILSELEKRGIINYIITQNVDGLHQLAGSKNVLELHGNDNYFVCTNCYKKYSKEQILEKDIIPYCDNCNSIIKPCIILYGECISDYFVWQTKDIIEKTDILIVLGSSLTVQTATNIVELFLKRKIKNDSLELYIINQGKTMYDEFANKYDDDINIVLKKALSYKK